MNVCQFLDQKHVDYEVLVHEPTYDAQHMAQAVHVKGKNVCKTVLLVVDHGYRCVTAIVPATKMINLELASAALGGCEVRLADEQELAEFCPDCEPGALPPFGSQYAGVTLVDLRLTDCNEIVFEGNRHCQSVRMSFNDFRRIESPLIVPLT